jgi:hypothetical protein
VKLRWLIPPLFIVAVAVIVGPDRLRAFVTELVETVRWADATAEGTTPPVASRRADSTTPTPTAKDPAPPAPAPPASLAEWLEPARFSRLHALIKPQAGESRWEQIAWHTDVWEARKQAAAEGKMLVIWWGLGHPLSGYA